MRQPAAKTNTGFKETISCEPSFLIFIAPKHWSLIKLILLYNSSHSQYILLKHDVDN